MLYNKSQQSRKTAGLCPDINWPENKKSAICKNANDTVINSVKLCSALAKPDTDIEIITESTRIVNPPEKRKAGIRDFTRRLPAPDAADG